MIYTTVNIFGALIEYFALYSFLWIFLIMINPRNHGGADALWECR